MLDVSLVTLLISSRFMTRFIADDHCTLKVVTMRSVHHNRATGRLPGLIQQKLVCRCLSTAALKESIVDARMSDSTASDAVNQVR